MSPEKEPEFYMLSPGHREAYEVLARAVARYILWAGEPAALHSEPEALEAALRKLAFFESADVLEQRRLEAAEAKCRRFGKPA